MSKKKTRDLNGAKKVPGLLRDLTAEINDLSPQEVRKLHRAAHRIRGALAELEDSLHWQTVKVEASLSPSTPARRLDSPDLARRVARMHGLHRNDDGMITSK